MNKIKILPVIFIFLIFSLFTFGQDPVDPPTPPPCPTTGNPPVGSPIEDGVPVVLALAFFYGAFKLRQVMKKKKEEPEPEQKEIGS